MMIRICYQFINFAAGIGVQDLMLFDGYTLAIEKHNKKLR
jgi:hypothetical protein